MNRPNAATLTIGSTGTRSEHSTQLSGTRLIFARAICVALIGFSLTIFFVDLPGYFVRLRMVCESSACPLWQLNSTNVLQLRLVGLTVGSYAYFIVALSVVAVFVWSAVGIFIAWRKSNDWMAFLVAILLVTTGIAGQSVPDFSYLSTPLVARSSPWFVPTIVVAFLAAFLYLLTFLLFPDGRFVPRWTRWLTVVGIVLTGSAAILFLSQTHFSPWLNPLIYTAIVVTNAPGLFAQLYRYRYVSTPTQRQQAKWVVLGAMLGILLEVAISPVLLLPSLNHLALYSLLLRPIAILILLFAPLSFAIAILRYRLWDIGILINRTLVYTTLTGMLALVYVGSILLLQGFLRGILHQDNEVAIVISTLVIAALFLPLRRRVQAIIDRRFSRRKYDAAKAVEALNATLRHEVNLDDLGRQLVAVVQETMQPSYVSLWLNPTKPERKDRATWSSPPPSP